MPSPTRIKLVTIPLSGSNISGEISIWIEKNEANHQGVCIEVQGHLSTLETLADACRCAGKMKIRDFKQRRLILEISTKDLKKEFEAIHSPFVCLSDDHNKIQAQLSLLSKEISFCSDSRIYLLKSESIAHIETVNAFSSLTLKDTCFFTKKETKHDAIERERQESCCIC
jgi:hypothetical protein